MEVLHIAGQRSLIATITPVEMRMELVEFGFGVCSIRERLAVWSKIYRVYFI
jgi:hypothetical protein